MKKSKPGRSGGESFVWRGLAGDGARATGKDQAVPVPPRLGEGCVRGTLAVPKRRRGQLAPSPPCPPAAPCLRRGSAQETSRAGGPTAGPPAVGWRWQRGDVAEWSWWLPSRSPHGSSAREAAAPARQGSTRLRLRPGGASRPPSLPKPPLQQGTGTGSTTLSAAPLASTCLPPRRSQGRRPTASCGCPGRPS